MELRLNANTSDSETEPIAKILRHAFRTIQKDLCNDYGGDMRHLWIDFELLQSHGERRARWPFRFQKRVTGSGFKKLTGLPAPAYENVGHYSVRPDFQELMQVPLASVASYALTLIYASTSVLVEKQKKLGGFDAQKFRRDFLASCNAHGHQVPLAIRPT